MRVTSNPSVVTEDRSAAIAESTKVFTDKANETVSRVVIEVLHTFSQAQAMQWPAFVATYVNPKQQALTEMDERTSKFFNGMMEAINPAVDAVPALNFGFQIFAAVSNDPTIRKKVVEGIALPHVKTMIAELDAYKPSIVDDIVAAS